MMPLKFIRIKVDNGIDGDVGTVAKFEQYGQNSAVHDFDLAQYNMNIDMVKSISSGHTNAFDLRGRTEYIG